MPTHFDKRNNRWRFSFNQVILGQRIRITKLLPKAWDRNQAKAFEQAETARLFGLANGTIKKRTPIQEAVDAYVEYQCPQLKNGDGVILELARLFGFYEGRYLDELSEVAREYSDVERERLKPASIKNKLSYLRAACRYAQKFHGIGDKDARYDVAMPAVKNARMTFISRAQMLRIAKHCTNMHARAVIRLAFYSGMRIGEILTIGATATVLADGFLLPDTKNNSVRIAPRHPKTRVLTRYFPLIYKKRWLQRIIRRAMDDAGFHEVHLHDVRHSTASEMINKGVDLYTVGGVLGHKDHRSTQRYSHLVTSTLNVAVLKIK
jgi:site-specific recombinase XerD